MKTPFGRAGRNPGETPTVVVHGEILEESQRLIRQNSHKEVGGKLLGFVVRRGSNAPSTPYGKSIRRLWDQISERDCLLLVATIPSGPKSVSTATSLIPDPEFQVAAFRAIEKQEPQIEHLGSWHSHHPNGLRRFSEADHRHYASVVADGSYNPNYFVAGLAFDSGGLRNGVFDLYARTHPEQPHRLNPESLTITTSIPSLQSAMRQIEAGLMASPAPGSTDLGQLAKDAIGMRLERAFGRGIERLEEESATSWVAHSDQADIVVTYAGGDPRASAVSIGIRTADAFLTLDSTGVPKDVTGLTKQLDKAMKSLSGALTLASKDAPNRAS